MKKVRAMRLSIAEKEARGTRRADRDNIRPLPEVQLEIEEALASLEDMRFNLREAGKAIRTEGVLIDVVSRNNGGQEVRTKKLNPACKLQKDMLGTIKSVKRALVLLREEEQLAQKAEKPEADEFAELD